MRCAVILLLAAACEDSSRAKPRVNADLVPLALADELVFVERTIQLQPDAISPTFTMRVPAAWEQSRALVRGDVLVNGAGDVNPDFTSYTAYMDPEMRLGKVELRISCASGCGEALEQQIFENIRDPRVAEAVVEEDQTAAEHTIVIREDDDDLLVLRLWRVPADSRFRSCWVRVDAKYATAYRAFVKACADIVERGP